MGGVVRDVDVLISEKPGGVVYASGDEAGHALKDAEGGEFGVVGLSHGDVPEPAQDENVLLVVPVRHLLEEFGDGGASERWILLLHDAEEAARGCAFLFSLHGKERKELRGAVLEWVWFVGMIGGGREGV